jgi:hypothetical protein
MPKGCRDGADPELCHVTNRNTATLVGMVFVGALLASPAEANAVLKQSSKMREQGMKLWRDGDFLGAFGSCFGAKQLLAGAKDAGKEPLTEAQAYADLCIGLALQSLKVRAKKHDYCASYLAAQKSFAIVDSLRKKRGEKLADGGYMTQQLQDSRCK